MNLARGLALLGVTLVTAGTACSFVLSRTDGQCNSHADCAARGGAFANSACTESHVCVPLPETHADSGTLACTKNSDCVGALGLSLCREVKAVDGGAADGGTPARECLKLNAKSCTSSNLGETSDNAVPIGLLTPKAAAAGTIDDTADLEKTARVVIKELGSATANPSLKADLPPFVGIVCDEADPASVDYLVNQLQVRLVVGGPRDLAQIGPILDKTRAAGAIFVSTLADDPALEATGNPNADGLFWSFHGNRMRWAPFFGDAIRKALDLAHLDANAPVFVAGFTDSATTNFLQRIQSTDAGIPFSIFSAKSRLEKDFTDYSLLAQQILAAKPRLIVAGSSLERWEEIIQEVETKWGTDPRPSYLLMEKSLALEAKFALIDSTCKCNASERVMGLNPHHDPGLYESFSQSYAYVNSSNPTYGPEVGYDALYESAYAVVAAAAAAKSSPLTVAGSAFKAAISSFNGPDGLPKKTGNAGIADVITSLGQKINLSGASGSLEFDVARGTPASDAEIYCFVKAKQRFCDTGIVFKSDSAGPPTGTNTCDCLH